LALLFAVPLLSARDKEVHARWEELAPLVEKRDVETVLRNGVHVRGRAEKVLPDALEVRVTETSDAAVIPKGRTRIPREQFAVLTVTWKQGPARYLLPAALVVGLPYLLFPGLGIDNEAMGTAPLYALLSAVGTVGYLVGARIDGKRIRVVVVPQRLAFVPRKGDGAPAEIEVEGGIP
jgi:hypothetical protein